MNRRLFDEYNAYINDPDALHFYVSSSNVVDRMHMFHLLVTLRQFNLLKGKRLVYALPPHSKRRDLIL